MAMVPLTGGSALSKSMALVNAQRQSPLSNGMALLNAHSASAQKQRTVYTPPSAPKTNWSTGSTRSYGGSSGGYSGGYSGGSSGSAYSAAAAAAARAAAEKTARENKQNEATNTQVNALKKMLDSTFGHARDTKLGNIKKVLGQQDAAMLSDFEKRRDQIFGAKEDNEKAEADSSFQNLANRARERGDIIAQALSQGAGESDTLRTQLMALRNWSANQSEINRSYYDTLRSANNTLTDLNADTRTARMNLQNQANADMRQIWNDYYNQVTDTWTQIGNLEGSNTNDSFKKRYSNAFDEAAKAAGAGWKDPGISKSVTDWKGADVTEQKLNNTDKAFISRPTGAMRRPEGASLRKW